MHRRTLLKASLALASLGLPAVPILSYAGRDTTGEPFSFDRLKQRARSLAERPYKSHLEKLPDTLTGLDPLDYQNIRYKPSEALWAGDSKFDQRMTFFHVGMQFNLPVRMHAVDPETQRSREIHFRPSLFDYDGSGVDTQQLKGQDLGFAGFVLARAFDTRSVDEAGAFLGASYFRFIDENKQYGLSARGLAVDTALNRSEEFPDFTEFWFVRPEPHSQTVTIYALLDSPSVTGAYRFDIDLQHQGAVMDIDMEIHARKAIERLGIAPMTSMFLRGTSQSQTRDTIHPQVHDSDRLSMWRGNGEWICRPLFNPRSLQYNAFADENPRGFGLVQQDHDFDNYRDDIAWYNRRPSLWVEPTGDWGKGSIALVELPTVGETVDNIVSFWVPEQPVEAGQTLTFGYKLYWWPLPPVSPSLAPVEKTWSGIGNVREGWIPGDKGPDVYARRFAIDFIGPPLSELPRDASVVADVSISRGDLGMVQARRFEPLNGYRAIFDWFPKSDSVEPVTMRVFLRAGDRTLTETWLYQWVPPKPSERHYKA